MQRSAPGWNILQCNEGRLNAAAVAVICQSVRLILWRPIWFAYEVALRGLLRTVVR